MGIVPLLMIAYAPLTGVAISVTGSQITITDDAQKGYVTAENDTIKVVWHYKTLSSEYNNRGGGSIYELYDKRTDPGAQHNLAALYDAGGAQTTPNTPGIGGLGAMHIWELGLGVSGADNGKFGRVMAHSQTVDADGNAVFRATAVVKSPLRQYDADESTRPDNYQVTKVWTVFPGGQIKLDISVLILRDFQASEPTYDFSFSQSYGFTTASSVGHRWESQCGGPGASGTTNPNNYNMVIDNLGSTGDYDYQPLHSEFFSLYGRTGGSLVRIKMDNGGKGFEGGGLFELGYRLWGNTTNNPTVEFSKYTRAAFGNTVRFMGWWGGAPPLEPRFKTLRAGTAWSDSLWIETYPEAYPAAPQLIGGSSVDQGNDGTAAVSWDTDIASDTTLDYRRADGTGTATTVSSPAWTPHHRVSLSGLLPGKNYAYNLTSRDGFGQVVQSGTFTAAGVPGVHLVLAMTGPSWQSYADYREGRMSVDFNVTNYGLEDASAVSVLAVTADSQVTGWPPADPAIGALPSGSRRSFRVTYDVPPGVLVFNTQIYVRATGVTGTDYYFPQTLPAA